MVYDYYKVSSQGQVIGKTKKSFAAARTFAQNHAKKHKTVCAIHGYDWDSSKGKLLELHDHSTVKSHVYKFGS